MVESPHGGPAGAFDAASAFDAALAGRVALPVGRWCTFQEVHWSYRRPISYDVYDAAGVLVAAVRPSERARRAVARVEVGGRPRLALRVDRWGSTSVTTVTGEELGVLARRFTVGGTRLDVIAGRQLVGRLRQDWTSPDAARVEGADGTVVAWIRRAAGGRFAGAAVSTLDLMAPARLPAVLLLAAIPALDMARRAARP